MHSTVLKHLQSLTRFLLMLPVYLAREVVFAHFVVLVNLITPKRRMDLIDHRLTTLGQALGLPRYQRDSVPASQPSRPPSPPGSSGQGGRDNQPNHPR